MKQEKNHTDKDNEAYEYMSGWRNDEEWSDLNAFLDEGNILLAANWLVGAGAIDSNNCHTESKEIEKYIECLAKEFRSLPKNKQSKEYDDSLKNYKTFSCDDCNHVSFVEKFNASLYEEELKCCWSCGSSKVIKLSWGE